MSEKLSLDGWVFEEIEWLVSDHIMTLTLNRPEVRNAMNAAMINELIYCLDYAKQTGNIRVVVIAAKGQVFCAGADLKMLSGVQEATRSTLPNQGDLTAISLRIRDLHKPVIVKAQGAVLAGALLLVCNATHVIAATTARFSAPEIKRGIWPFMVMASLFRVMPKRAGLDFIMRGRDINAEQALSWGLISEAVAAEELNMKVMALAQELASLAPRTMQAGLAAYYHQENQSLDEALPDLQKMLSETLNSADAKEGIAAFLQKRSPQWDDQ